MGNGSLQMYRPTCSVSFTSSILCSLLHKDTQKYAEDTVGRLMPAQANHTKSALSSITFILKTIKGTM